jgi:hypothetical protein
LAVTEQTTLALTMRPRSFDEVIGLEKPIAVIKNKLDSGEVPRAILLRGPYGTGKTTLAHIIARYVQGPFFEGNPSVNEVNGANYRKIENMRTLSEEAGQYPMPPSTYHVIILDECHKLTGDAQDLLLKELEVPRSSTVWILGTTNPEKLNQGVRDRCFQLETEPMNPAQRHELLKRAAEKTEYGDSAEITKLEALLTKHAIVSPRRILGAFELMKSGLDAQAAVAGVNLCVTPEYNDIAFAVVFGKWDADTVVFGGKVPVRSVGSMIRDLEDKLSVKAKSETEADDVVADDDSCDGKPDAAHALRAITGAFLKGRCLPKALKGGKYKFPLPQDSERAYKAFHALANIVPTDAYELLWPGTIIALYRVNQIMQGK